MRSPDPVAMDENFASFAQHTNIIFVVDHAGRAGNGFFQTIFDQHPQVVACPWIHYIYSYLITEFGDAAILDAKMAWKRWKATTYFSLIYNEPESVDRSLIRKMGGDPDAKLDRGVVRSCFDRIILAQEKVTRKELVQAIFYSYLAGLGRDTNNIRYIVCTDSISLKNESAMAGFSGKVVDAVTNDFPDARLVHLVRDPRAGFASTNHQFVNQLGNMYGLRLGNFWSRLRRLVKRDFDWDSVFVFGFWLIYFRRTFDAIMKKRAECPNSFITVRNEDLNLDFANTMRAFAGTLGISRLDCWTDDFQPTMLGLPWAGTGAYNSRYQRFVHGPLRNDPDHVSRKATGPNAYVTRRWRTQLSQTQIFIVEGLLAPELEAFGYEFLFWRGGDEDKTKLRRLMWRPLRGELPTVRWLLESRFTGVRDLLDRMFYCIGFPVFFVVSRIVFGSIIRDPSVFKECPAKRSKEES